MAAATIDYDKLAQQHGGTAVVDYDALAAQHGGTVQSSPATPPADTRTLFQKAKDSFSPSNLINNVGTGLKQLGQGTVQGLSDIGGAILPQSLGGDPINNLALVRHIVQPMQDEAAKARAAEPNGKITAAGAAHALASGIPVVGPWAANLGEQAATGDVGGAVARGGTQLLAPKLIGPAADLAVRGASKVALLGKTPEGAMESALKPSTTISPADRTAITQTALQNSIPVSAAGVEKLHDLIENLDQKKADFIKANPGRTIDPNAVATRADAAKAKFSQQVNAQGDLNAIEASKQQFLREQGAPNDANGNVTGPAPPMSAADAQAMKSGTYRVLKGKYGEQGSAAVEAQKDLARGLKEEIATQFPEINDINGAQSALLDLQPVLERAVNRISNHQAIGIGTPIAGAAAKAVTGSGAVGIVTGVMKAVLDNPELKSRLAIAVSKGGKIPYSQALSRVNAYATSLGSAALGSQAYSSGDNPNQPTTPQP